MTDERIIDGDADGLPPHSDRTVTRARSDSDGPAATASRTPGDNLPRRAPIAAAPGSRVAAP